MARNGLSNLYDFPVSAARPSGGQASCGDPEAEIVPIGPRLAGSELYAALSRGRLVVTFECARMAKKICATVTRPSGEGFARTQFGAFPGVDLVIAGKRVWCSLVRLQYGESSVKFHLRRRPQRWTGEDVEAIVLHFDQGRTISLASGYSSERAPSKSKF